MPTFTYKAKDNKGALIQGVMEADGRPAVVARLQAMGLFPVAVEGTGASAKAGGGNGAQKSALPIPAPAFVEKIRKGLTTPRKRIRSSDMASFNRQLSD